MGFALQSRSMAYRVQLLTLLCLAIGTVPRAQAPAIRVVLLGTGAGPTASAERAGPSAWVEAGQERLFIDAGRTVVQRLAQAGLTPRDVTRLFLTHLHSDHVVGLPDLWLTGWWMFR